MITCACGAEAVVQWRRRLPGEKSKGTEPVYACADHALTLEAAGLVHEASCAGPGKNSMCSCTPEPIEFPFSDSHAPPKRRMPPGW